MPKKKKKVEDVEVVLEEEVLEEASEEMVEAESKEDCKEEKCDGMVMVMITDNSVKLNGVLYKKHDTLSMCKEDAMRYSRCTIL